MQHHRYITVIMVNQYPISMREECQGDKQVKSFEYLRHKFFVRIKNDWKFTTLWILICHCICAKFADRNAASIVSRIKYPDKKFYDTPLLCIFCNIYTQKYSEIQVWLSKYHRYTTTTHPRVREKRLLEREKLIYVFLGIYTALSQSLPVLLGIR